MTPNGSQLPEGGDFETQNCQQIINLNRSTTANLTIEPPLLGRCCYGLPFLHDIALGGLCKTHNYYD
jgi:hypothetical protein